MKAFVSACVAAIAVAVIAWLVLDVIGMSSSEYFASGSTRL